MFTYAHQVEFGTGDLIGVRHGFELSATNLELTPSALRDTITVTTSYRQDDVGSAIEDDLQLYGLEPPNWITRGITSTADVASNILTALVDRLGPTAELGEMNRLFMPVVFKSADSGW